jgi:hypothetical protein
MDMTFQGAVDRLPDAEANYLGDPDVIEALIRQFITALVDNAKAATSDDAAAAGTQALASEYAKFLAGLDPAYPPVEDWNTTRLGPYAAKFLGLEMAEGDTVEAVMRDAWASIVIGFYDALAKVAESNSVEPMDFYVERTIETWRAVFLGLPIPTPEESADV